MKFLPSILTVTVLLLVACQPEPNLPTPVPEKTTAEKIAGKWKADRLNIDYYDPIPVLSDTVRFKGLPADSIVFKNTGLMYNYIADPVPDIVPYTIVNNNSIMIDGEKFQIKELTANKLRLYMDTVYVADNERTVVDFYLFR
jgi:hypothetical protein